MCVYCGHKYSTPEEMARCILKCSEMYKKEHEKEIRFKEIQEVNDKLNNLVKEYEKDYKEIVIGYETLN